MTLTTLRVQGLNGDPCSQQAMHRPEDFSTSRSESEDDNGARQTSQIPRTYPEMVGGPLSNTPKVNQIESKAAQDELDDGEASIIWPIGELMCFMNGKFHNKKADPKTQYGILAVDVNEESLFGTSSWIMVDLYVTRTPFCGLQSSVIMMQLQD